MTGMDTPPADPNPAGDAELDPVQAGAQVRTWTTWKITALVESLEPYVNGTFGEVSPRHAATYLAACRELNRLWRAQVPAPPPPEPSQEELEAAAAAEAEQAQRAAVERAEAVRGRVLAELEELRARS